MDMILVEFLLRWVHFLAGITWIGMLYYFNFVQTPFFKSCEGSTRSEMIRGLVPNALWWFRWGAMFTFLTGLTIVMMKAHSFKIPWSDPYMTIILTGGLMGTLMWFNVWFIIWPNQQKALGLVPVEDSEKPAAARTAMLFSRTNTLLSIPMLYCMVGMSHGGF